MYYDKCFVAVKANIFLAFSDFPKENIFMYLHLSADVCILLMICSCQFNFVY